MTSKSIKVKIKTQPSVVMEAEVARKIRQHARTSMKAEVCGVLLGSAEQDRTVIEACIAGINAAQGGAHVTFTQDTWEHIYKIKDQQFPESKIVGWYHSHPGFGVFLSEHDLFIQENFFSSPQQVAWVYDPHTDEEGCFGWVGGATEKLSSMRFGYSQNVEISGSASGNYEEDSDADPGFQIKVRSNDPDREPAWVTWTSRTLMAVLLVAVGFAAGLFFWDMSPWARSSLRTLAEDIRQQELQLQQACDPELRACQARLLRTLSPVLPVEPQSGIQGAQQPLQPQQKEPAGAGKGNNGKH
jgi:proteasome lid subunit RPN8/RPN11